MVILGKRPLNSSFLRGTNAIAQAQKKGLIMLKILIAITFVFSSLIATAEDQAVEAPFGLEWGAEKGALRGDGIILSDCKSEGWVEYCTTESVPKNLSVAESYVLYFSKEYGLQKVLMVGETFTNDVYGIAGKDRYAKLKGALDSKYSGATSYEYVGRTVYNESDEFFQCLDYAGCGNWGTYWTDNIKGSVVLELMGLRRGSGFVKLSYEGELWSRAISEKDKVEDAADFEAL